MTLAYGLQCRRLIRVSKRNKPAIVYLPFSLFLTVDRPLGTNSFLSPAFCCRKIKDGSHNFVKKILCTRSPKLRLLCRLVRHKS